VLHTHSRAGVAVSAQKCGVLPISQQSIFVLNSLAYHDYEGVALRDDEKVRLQADLGDACFLMLRNHGLLTVARTIADAFMRMYSFENTCRIQIDAQAGGELIPVDQAIVQGAAQASRTVTLGQGPGALAWPALLRKCDRMDPSYKT
jgi:ribulose-5-phosphate 4-epimerase/fuculose-1-phosphate aldolase